MPKSNSADLLTETVIFPADDILVTFTGETNGTKFCGTTAALLLPKLTGAPMTPDGGTMVLVWVTWSDLTTSVNTIGVPQTKVGWVLNVKKLRFAPLP